MKKVNRMTMRCVRVFILSLYCAAFCTGCAGLSSEQAARLFGVERKGIEVPDEPPRENTIAPESAGGILELADMAVGDIVIFGMYEQDNDIDDGTEMIEWIVLEISDDKVLLLAYNILDCRPYHEKSEPVTWEDCDMRKWLNNEFYESAFNEDERKHILETRLDNNDNEKYDTDGGRDTLDKVFCLSLDELGEYDIPTETLRAGVTLYAQANRAYVSEENEYGFWWLRSPGRYGFLAAQVSSLGSPLPFGDNVEKYGNGVRPAVWVEIYKP